MPFTYFSARERLRRQASAWFARLQGPATEEDKESFRRWYDASPANAEAYERIRATWGRAALLRTSDIATSSRAPQKVSAGAPSRGLAAAAAVVLLACGSLLLLNRSPDVAHQEKTYFATVLGEVREFPLDDGSRLTLDTDTSVAVAMDAARRQVTLHKGRVRVSVAADPRPFVVQAGGSEISAPAGVFDVSRLGGEVSVLALEGVARLQQSGTDVTQASDHTVLVRTGQQAVSIQGRPLAAPQSAPAAASRWPAGMIEFDGTPLSEAAAEANRYSAAKIRIADPAISGLKVTGAFHAGDTGGLARSLAHAFGLRVARNAAGDFLLLAPAQPAR